LSITVGMDTMTPAPIIPNEFETEEQMRRARHLDLDQLSTEAAWAELMLLRPHLARLILRHRRPRLVVRMDGGHLVDEREWATERVRHLDRLLSKASRAVA
jgi:hypothetical protein